MAIPKSNIIRTGITAPARYIIPLAPQTKDRPRGMVVKGKGGQLISVQRKTNRNRAYESLIQEFAMEQHPVVGAFSNRLSVSIAYYCEQMRGDLDNLIKATLDGLNKGIFTDDCLIDELHARRVKAPPGIQPQSIVRVSPISPVVFLPHEAFKAHECPMCGQALPDVQEIPF
jgi:Holliday junction resolvase RusA-like endonuclease